MPLTGIYILGSIFLRCAPFNGADMFTPLIYNHFGQKGVIVFGLLILLTSVIIYSRLKKEKSFKIDYIFLVLMEGSLFAVGIALFVGLIVRYICPVAQSNISVSLPSILTVSSGAGVYEELLFRVAILGGLYGLILGNTKNNKILAAIVAVSVSAAMFSLAHFFVEKPTVLAFWYRFYAGVFLGGLYLWRGYGVCAYSHFVFDILVLALTDSRATSFQ
jgi:membrane protease YdiL (CAAX protease family)